MRLVRTTLAEVDVSADVLRGAVGARVMRRSISDQQLPVLIARLAGGSGRRRVFRIVRLARAGRDRALSEAAMAARSTH